MFVDLLMHNKRKLQDMFSDAEVVFLSFQIGIETKELLTVKDTIYNPKGSTYSRDRMT